MSKHCPLSPAVWLRLHSLEFSNLSISARQALRDRVAQKTTAALAAAQESPAVARLLLGEATAAWETLAIADEADHRLRSGAEAIVAAWEAI